MVLKKLSVEQIEKMSLEEKDRWWLNNIYKGKVPQLTFRSITLGCILGVFQSVLALYASIKVPFCFGSGVLSVICAFSLFNLTNKILGLNKGKDSIIECNAVQSISVSAAMSIFPLAGSLSAYMLFSNIVVPLYQTILWMITACVLGVTYAMFFKKNIINDLQLPCQEGAACAIVLDTITNQEDRSIKTNCLAIPFFISSALEIFKCERIFANTNLKFLLIPESFKSLLNKLPTYFGYKLTDLGFNVEISFFTFGVGGMMPVGTTLSMLTGGVIFYMGLCPMLLDKQIISLGYKSAMGWSIWPGMVMMTVTPLFKLLVNMKDALVNYKAQDKDILQDIEVPRNFLLIGLTVTSILAILLGKEFFNIPYYMGIICVIMTYFLSYVACHAGGMTSYVPAGAIAKITQLVTTIFTSSKIGLAAAGLTGEISGNAGSLLIDLKPGYMLGAGPRQQVIGHIIGVFVGTIAGSLFFYTLLVPRMSEWGSNTLPMPGTMVWKAVADILSVNWWQVMHPSVLWAMGIALVASIILEFLSSKKTLNLSAAMIGFGLFLPFNYSIEMFLGSLVMNVLFPYFAQKSKTCSHISQNSDIVCAGLLVGNSIIGIILMTLLQVI